MHTASTEEYVEDAIRKGDETVMQAWCEVLVARARLKAADEKLGYALMAGMRRG